MACWFNVGWFNVDLIQSVPGMSVALVACKKKYQNPSWVWCKAINKVIQMLLIVLFIYKAA